MSLLVRRGYFEFALRFVARWTHKRPVYTVMRFFCAIFVALKLAMKSPLVYTCDKSCKGELDKKRIISGLLEMSAVHDSNGRERQT